MKEQFQQRTWIWGLMGLQLLLGLFFINSFPIALDEPFSIFHAQKSLPDLWEVFRNENNPPLHFILLHFWIKIFGTSAMAVRFLSLIFSVLTIPALFKLGRKYAGKFAGLLLVGLFIFASFHHYHAIEARVYSLFVCLFAWIVYDLYQVIFEQKKTVIWRLMFWNVALLYSHYLAGFVILCELMILMYFYKRISQKQWLNALFGGVVGIILFIPGIQLWLTRYEAFSGNRTWVPEPHWTEIYGNVLRFFNGKWSVIMMLMIFILIGVFRIKHLKSNWKSLFAPANQFIFLFFGLTYIGMFVVSVVFKPIFLDRYLLYTSILLFLMVVIIMKALLWENRFSMALFLLVPMMLFCDYQPDNDRNPNELAQWIHDQETADRSIIICPPFYDLTFLYHYDETIFANPMDKESNMRENQLFSAYTLADIESEPLQNQVFFVDANASFLYPGNGIKDDLLLEGYQLVESKEFKGGFHVWKYERASPFVN
jgi:uncharacterized membrane protein